MLVTKIVNLKSRSLFLYPDQLVTLVRGDRKKFAKGTMDLGVEFFFLK